MAASTSSGTTEPNRLPVITNFAQKLQGLAPFVAGAASGLVTSATLQPLDVIKTRMQAAHFCGEGTLRMGAVTRGLMQKEGVQALWSGVGPACIRLGCGAGLYFLILDKVRPLIARHTEGSGWVNSLATVGGGALSRSLAAAALCPVTVVKTRMEYSGVSGVKYANTVQALLSIARTERLRGLWSGLGATLLRDAPYSGLYLLLYTRLQAQLNDTVWLTSACPPSAINFLSGAVAGCAATLVTHPPDVVRTRSQLTQYTRAGGIIGKAAGGAASGNISGNSLIGIARMEGFGALWIGVGPRVLRRTLQMAITWTLYEELVLLLKNSPRDPS